MKSSEGKSAILNILQILNKIKPYQLPSEMEKGKHGVVVIRKHFHHLELTEPEHLLEKIFHPYLLVVKFLGCLPLKIKDGSAHFRYFSWNVLYSLSVFSVFIFDTTFFLPVMQYMNSEEDANFLVYVTEILLVTSQIFAAQMSYIFIAARAKKLAEFWNRLQNVLVRLVARCPNHLDLLCAYQSARKKIIVWLMFTVVFGACYVVSFHNEITAYLLGSLGGKGFYYYFMYFGFCFYSVMLSIHILHSTSFTTFVCVISTCFQCLGRIVTKQDGEGKLVNSQSPILFEEALQIYEELLELKCCVGEIYGIYMALEILAMIICCTINIFFMISRPDDYSLVCLNVAILMPYLIWFHGICDVSGYLNISVKDCYKNIRKALASAVRKTTHFPEGTYLHVEKPSCLSAAGYFLIDMKLFTTVIGTIATYLVVMLQFGSGMKRGDNLQQKLISNRNSTRDSYNEAAS